MSEGTKYEVRFSVQVPDGVGATDQAVYEWVCFGLHENGTLSSGNPLIDHEMEAAYGSVYVSRITPRD